MSNDIIKELFSGVSIVLKDDTCGYDGVNKHYTGSFIFEIQTFGRSYDIIKIVEVKNNRTINSNLQNAENELYDRLRISLVLTVINNII